jgi:3-hydroxyisobutyrate dehydrogenase
LKTANIFVLVFEPDARTTVRTGFFQSILLAKACADIPQRFARQRWRPYDGLIKPCQETQTWIAPGARRRRVADKLSPAVIRSGKQELSMATNGKTQKPKIGWIGAGRMGIPMAERLIKGGYDVSIWNRTRAKAAPLEKIGGRLVEHLADLKSVDVLFSIVATGKDVQEVLYGKNGVCSQGGRVPPTVVDCSTIAVEESAAIRERLKQLGAEFVAAPVSGNAKVIKAGKLSAVVSGQEAVCKAVMPLIEVFAPRGVSYVGDGELARVCKIAHNVMLGVIIENLIEMTLLTNKMGVPRHAWLAFLNNSAMGSMFTRYKAPALVNLDWTTTFTPELLRKDLDLGLELGREMDVPLPVTAAAREVLQSHFGAAILQKNPEEYLQKDFSALAETMALAAGMKLESENKNVPTGLES